MIIMVAMAIQRMTATIDPAIIPIGVLAAGITKALVSDQK